MPGTIIESVLTGKVNLDLLIKWLNNINIEVVDEDCILLCYNRNEFVAHFLAYLRDQTDGILKTNSNVLQVLQHQNTPEKLLKTRRKHQRSISDPQNETDKSGDTLTVKTDRNRSQESPNRDKKKSGRRIKTKLFEDKSKDSISSDESRLNVGIDRLMLSSSTPLKNVATPIELTQQPFSSPVTPTSRSFQFERCDTPRLYRHSRSHDKSISLGDFLVVAPKSSKKKKSRNASSDLEESRTDLDISNSEVFPEISSRKASSLKADRRRINPTNIDNSKSQSLNSFNSESFQQPSPISLQENLAFRHQMMQPRELSNSFETERNILKQERHKLMEKFNILNTSTPQKPVMPQIKINKEENKIQTYVKADANKVVFKDKIDILVEIYNTLLKNNLILTLNTEIYFLISVLLAKQYEDEYLLAEKNLNDNNINEYLLKSIHNSTYFSVKSLWNQRSTLDVILDKNSLKILGENKKVRSFYPDLAKFLLNSYGLKCELEKDFTAEKRIQDQGCSNGVVCFNFETDSIDNFPSMLSFQNFKKQRDMFYEIARWYNETQQNGASKSSFKARIKALLSCGTSASNHAHLASLFTQHMVAECLPNDAQESKLSKLQRRLTCPTAAPEAQRFPHFSSKEKFYKEFIMYAENESFRVHLTDALSTEVVTLDAAQAASEDRGNMNNSEVIRDFLQASKKLRLLAKFLGYLASLPYCQTVEITVKTGSVVKEDLIYSAPKEKVLESNIAMRNYKQPSLDLKGILMTSHQNGRLTVTIPWLTHYLAMLDYSSLRTKYYHDLVKYILKVYTKLSEKSLKRNTFIFLKLCMGFLFSLPHFPQEFFYQKADDVVYDIEAVIDNLDLINEVVMFELCPFLRDIGVLLSSCKVVNDQKDVRTFRHITPVSLGMNIEDRIKNKEQELQTRLEEEFLKSQPSSTRRVLDLVTERVSSGCVREINNMLTAARQSARQDAQSMALHTDNQEQLLQSLKTFYSDRLQSLRTSSLEYARSEINSRVSNALSALLPNATSQLCAIAMKKSMARVNRWIDENWSTTAVLCKDIEEEMKTLVALGEALQPKPPSSPRVTDGRIDVSVATTIIELKEQICLLLEYSATPDLPVLLTTAALAVSKDNVFCLPHNLKALLQLSVDLCVVYVSRRPNELTEEFLPQLHSIWDTCCPDRKRYVPQELSFPERRENLSPVPRIFEDDDRAPTPVSDDDGPMPTKIIILPMTNSIFNLTSPQNLTSPKNLTSPVSSPLYNLPSPKLDDTKVEESTEGLEFFDRVLCGRNIVLLSESKCKSSEVWEGLAKVLVFMLKNDFLSEDSLTEQCLAVYRQDWPQPILENLSTCMKLVSSQWCHASVGKFTLFLDFLAEFCGDMDTGIE